MPDQLPEITLADAVIIPPAQAKTFSKGFLSSLNLAAFLDETPWTMNATLLAYDPATGEAAADPQTLRVDNLKLAMAVYPLVAQVGGGILSAVSLLLVPLKIEAAIGASLVAAREQADAARAAAEEKDSASIAASQWAAAVAQRQAGNSPTKDADVAYAQSQVELYTAQAAAADDVVDAMTSELHSTLSRIWVTLLDQWRAAASPLGVSDPAAMPMALYGLTRPEGV